MHLILSKNDSTRLRLGLQIEIFGIIAQASDFPKLALQNCKSDMHTSSNMHRQHFKLKKEKQSIESIHPITHNPL